MSAPIWHELGLPGLADVHVHVMPPSVERKVWDFFDHAQEHYGQAWPLAYAWPLEERRKELQTLGVLGYPGLVYPHKAEMAQWLNGWALDYAAATPEVVPSATFFPEPGAVSYVERAIESGARIFKAHVQVGGYDPRDPLLDGVWGLLAEAGIPVVTHCGDGPVPGVHTGVDPIAEVMARNPRLRLVIAHAGMPRYGDFIALAAQYESVMLDTTMAFTPRRRSDCTFSA
jgi:predicted TIM-barrel fold metal-dependent hydrolase